MKSDFIIQTRVFDNNDNMSKMKQQLIDIQRAVRQTGSSTNLIKAASACNGIILTSNFRCKQVLQSLASKVIPGPTAFVKIYTVSEFWNMSPGRSPNVPVFYDNVLVWELCQPEACGAGSSIQQPQTSKKLTTQVNTRVSDADAEKLKELNDNMFDGEAKQSMIARLAMRKGMEQMLKEANIEQGDRRRRYQTK